MLAKNKFRAVSLTKTSSGGRITDTPLRINGLSDLRQNVRQALDKQIGVLILRNERRDHAQHTLPGAYHQYAMLIACGDYLAHIKVHFNAEHQTAPAHILDMRAIDFFQPFP